MSISHWLAGLVLLLPLRLLGASREIWIVAQPWPAPFSPGELAAALRLRLPAVVVRLADSVPGDGTVPFVQMVAGDPPRIRVLRREEVLLDAPLVELGDEAARRAALFAAIAFETAPELAAEPPPRLAAASPPPISVIAASPAPAAPAARWAIAASVGPALAIDDSSAAVALALLLRFHAPLRGHASLEVGAKLSSSYTASSGDDELSIVDRAIWVGASYRIGSRPLSVELGLAAQYTHPSVDADGPDLQGVRAPVASRFGARVSAGASWAVHGNLALVLGTALTFALADRGYSIGDRDIVELGSATLDLTLGPEVRW
jgi:hypothetical protein